MNYQQIQQEKAKEREELSRKIAAGQSFEAHLREKSAFDIEDLRKAQIVVQADGKPLVLRPQGPRS